MNELVTYGFEERHREIWGHGVKVDVAPFLCKAEKKVDIAKDYLFIYISCFIQHVISCKFWSILHPTGFLICHPFSFPLTPRYRNIVNNTYHK